MASQKDALREKFSADYQRYYLVDLFKRRGYVRKKCVSCGKHFWTLKTDAERCDDQPCSPYTFIGDSPARKGLDYIQTWKTVENFFVKNGHTSVKRYPVVSRWRPDLYFTVASIIDFQRNEGGKMVFELPANPLVVPQMCLRFNDIPNVGVSGKHYTSFCMIGQTAIDDGKGYWKDRCIDLDFELVTKELGIAEEEVSFNEDVWLGYGAFGYSLEYFVRGLELGNAVFTAFEGDATSYQEMKNRVVDMGAGLERFSWITQGTPTAYDSSFASVLANVRQVCKIEYDRDLFMRYSSIAGRMNFDEFADFAQARDTIARSLGVDAQELTRQLAPLEGMYAIVDHARTLLFAITDGLLPSNVGGGYNLRVLFRRAESFARRFGFNIKLEDVVNWHIDYLSQMYPELRDHRDDVSKVLAVESSRFTTSMQRVSNTISSLKASSRELKTDDILKLYDSDGITPEELLGNGVKVTVPEDFYDRVLSRHSGQKSEKEAAPKFDISDLPLTRLLYYEDEKLYRFRAKVLRVFEDRYVVLDQTAFYPRGGGQEPDHGTMDGVPIVDIEKYGGVVIHRLGGGPPSVGSTVEGVVEANRREKITRIHTATHILNGSSRQVLGPWIWQHSAFKEEDYGRIDITHFSNLAEDDIQNIEDVANGVVMKDLPITATFMPRMEAEERYGFHLYQGGVVPTSDVRVVDIGGWDIEACGGTHTRSTGEIGLIKIVKTERIQDGVVRLDFVAGLPAIQYMHQVDSALGRLSSLLATQRENVTRVATAMKEELEEARRREKALGMQLVELSIPEVMAAATAVGGVKFYVSDDQQLGEELIIAQGQKCVGADPSVVFVSIAARGASCRIICFSGREAVGKGVFADSLVKSLAQVLGGSGGGTKSFAQGGGTAVGRIHEAAGSVGTLIGSMVKE